MKICSDYAIQMRNISKIFGKYKALDNINLDIKKGSIHALLGENGAGKSTLMSILYGLYQKDSGKIFVNGKELDIKNPQTAIENGIGMVHQHFKLIENFTVAQNIMLGCEISKHFGFLDMRKVKSEINKLSLKYGLNVDPDAKIEDISVGMQQRVEILKTLFRGAEILILDEPTAVLTPNEVSELMKTFKILVKNGKTIIIITHKLKEIKESSQFCTIIRKGKYIDTLEVSACEESELAHKMVGRNVNLTLSKSPADFKETIFEINDLVVKNEKNNNINIINKLNLKIRKGEILGLAGVDGNGQKELVEAITGLIKTHSGTIKINGVEIQNTKPKTVIKNKISIIHEDRQKRGLILDFSVAENAILEKYNEKPFSKKGILNEYYINKFTDGLVDEYKISPQNCYKTPIKKLSGGNQQKLIIAREIANKPDLLIAVQPTRGLDVGAIEYVHKTLIKERDNGKAILLISLDLDEIMDLSDTISVIYNGEILETFIQNEADEKTLGLLMAGGKKNAENNKNS